MFQECREAMSVTAVKGTSENVWVTDGEENTVTDNKRKTQVFFCSPSLHKKLLHIAAHYMWEAGSCNVYISSNYFHGTKPYIK